MKNIDFTGLVNGSIPKGSVCPFKEECYIYKNNNCNHLGVDHGCDFSCGAARALSTIKRNKEA